ncbi:MAG: hypothetical protein KAH95_13310 [Spirochaetales bacterium]|nr:hypothetical protein [Spirochaetales bacterium]
MKKIIIIAVFITTLGTVFSQDLELFNRTMDDRLILPEIPIEMTIDEFQILSRDIKLMDMAAGIAFPGYISFKAKEQSAAYIAIAVRSVGYIGAAFELYRYHDTGTIEFWSNNFDRNIMYGTIGILLGSYIFDWLFGKSQLEIKQEEIRFKYRQELINQSSM